MLGLYFEKILCEVSLDLLEWLMIQLSRQDVAQRELVGYSSYSSAPNDSRSSSGVYGFWRTFVSAYMSLSSGSSRAASLLDIPATRGRLSIPYLPFVYSLMNLSRSSLLLMSLKSWPQCPRQALAASASGPVLRLSF